MAKTMTKKATATKSTAEIKDTPIVEVKEEAVVAEKKVKTKTPKKFEPDEGIPCRSITVGGLYMEGKKSHILYEWVNDGDITEVEYQDLLASVRSNENYVFLPRFIIEDEDFLAQNPKVQQLYDNMYNAQDLREVFDYPVNQMVTAINSLPEGAKNSIKHMASRMIMSGELDSMSKIKALDEIYGTKLVLMAIEG